jgi:UDP-2,3-diacylglucosamine hydrolase
MSDIMSESPRTLFISDLHLSPAEPETINLFLKFINQALLDNLKALYILGDFFNYWIGNDSLEPWHQPIIAALNKLAKTTKIYFLAGNRDFLVNSQTSKIFGFDLISEDYKIINIYNYNITLLHGDTLCTLDRSYQIFRKITHSWLIRTVYLNLPLNIRQKLVRKIQAQSSSNKPLPIDQSSLKKHLAKYNVCPKAVANLFTKTKTDIIIHGHTHQPKVHQYDANKYRYVLGDWHKSSAYYLEVTPNNIDLKIFS